MLRRNISHLSSDSDIMGYSSDSKADSDIVLSSDIHLLSRLGGGNSGVESLCILA